MIRAIARAIVQDRLTQAEAPTLEELMRYKNFTRAMNEVGGLVMDQYRLRTRVDELLRPLLAGAPPMPPAPDPALRARLQVPAQSRCLYACAAKCQAGGDVMAVQGTAYLFDTTLCFARTFWPERSRPLSVAWRNVARVVKALSGLLDVTTITVRRHARPCL
jgi:hypothetical protein